MPKIAKWWQHYFKDHPDRANKSGPAWLGDKAKVYCIECFDHHVAMIQSEYDEQIRQGINPMIPRESLAIEAYCPYNLYSTNLLY
jgi:hypothetical protein